MGLAKLPRVIASLEKNDSLLPKMKEKSTTIESEKNKITNFLGSYIEDLALDEEFEKRTFNDFKVKIGKSDGCWRYIIMPIEHSLTNDERLVVESILAHLPDKLDIDVSLIMKDQKLARELVKNAISQHLPKMRIDKMSCAELISRYSVGFGPIELLLADPLVEDIIVNAPSSLNQVCVVTKRSKIEFGSIFCTTNLTISEELLSSIVTKTRIFHGGELSSTKPILEIELPHLKTRMSAAGDTASKQGLSVALRKRSEFLWTLSRLVGDNTLSWSAAGFLSLCCAARASIVIVGGRGAGKTTFLSSLLPELPADGRSVIMEDTEELPALQLQKEGMSIQTLSLSGGAEKASMVMRAALRMGEGPIIVGEIRGEESKVLFESMRTGTASSCVLGTLHASDARAVRDRIVLDMGMNEKSFEAIDLIVAISQKKNITSGSSRRYLSEISSVKDSGINPIFICDESGHSRTCHDGFNNLGVLGLKLSAHLGIEERQMLSASRIRGFSKLIQASEWIETGNDAAVSVRTTRRLNSIDIDYSKEPDWNSLRKELIGKIHEVSG